MTSSPLSRTTRSQPLRGARKLIASRMMESLANSAQLSFHSDFDITDLIIARSRWKKDGRLEGIEDCLIAALADSMAAHPDFNGQVEGDVFVACEAVDISVAISIDGLLITPVIRAANRLALGEIASERKRLIERVRDRALQASEVTGGTATLSNLGRTSVRYFTPILNKGQLVILGIGRIEDCVAITDEGKVIKRQYIGLSLTVDHRFIDGDPAAKLLSDIGARLATIYERF